MKILFDGETYEVIDQTQTHYVCAPENRNEGYHFISKSKSQIISEFD